MVGSHKGREISIHPVGAGEWENGRMGERESGRAGEWENGRMGEWENGRVGALREVLPFSRSPALPLSLSSQAHIHICHNTSVFILEIWVRHYFQRHSSSDRLLIQTGEQGTHEYQDPLIRLTKGAFHAFKEEA